jgi:hypothetical protein
MAQPLEHFEAINAWKHNVQDDQCKGLSGNHSEAQLSRIGGRDGVVFVSRIPRNQLTESDVIIDQQKLGVCLSPLD